MQLDIESNQSASNLAYAVTWRRRAIAAPGSADRPLRSSVLCLPQISDDAPKLKSGTVLIPLQSAEGQRQRQGRHQG